jgi:TolB-like protein
LKSNAYARAGFSTEDYRTQLTRILTSADFHATDRERRFLSYVVDETLAGRSDRIKAYSIAVEVFDRDASFDPQADPIVRVTAGQLRRALERYYLTAGLADPILISIPKGGYVATFALRDAEGPAVEELASPAASESPKTRLVNKSRLIAALAVIGAAALALVLWAHSSLPSASKPETPHLLVEWFDGVDGSEKSAALARGLTQEIISKLSRFKGIVVVQPHGQVPSDIRYAVTGSVDMSADTLRFRVRMYSRADGRVLWAQNYDGTTSVPDLLGFEADIATSVATNVAQSYGVIFEADSKRITPDAPDDQAAYFCTLSYYSYRVNFDPKARPSVRSCLEKAVERFPTYATAWALLSQVYIDEVRFRFPFDAAASAPLIDRALAAANRALQLEPANVRGLQAQMLALYFNGEIDAAMAAGRSGMAANPDDTVFLGEYGYRLALSGNWKEGCPLVAQARERNPGPLAYYEVGLAICAYFSGDMQQAVMWIRKASVTGNALYHLIAAAIFVEAGYAQDAADERDWIMKHEPGLVANMRYETLMRFGQPKDAERFLASLRKAGIEFPD